MYGFVSLRDRIFMDYFMDYFMEDYCPLFCPFYKLQIEFPFTLRDHAELKAFSKLGLEFRTKNETNIHHWPYIGLKRWGSLIGPQMPS